jgi:hypothetical protein
MELRRLLLLQVLSYDVCFPAGRSRAYLTMQVGGDWVGGWVGGHSSVRPAVVHLSPVGHCRLLPGTCQHHIPEGEHPFP